MVIDFSSRRLEQEVDNIMSASLKAGLGSSIIVNMPGRFNKAFSVDRVVLDEGGYPAEIWLSAPARRSIWDALRGLHRVHLLRVSRFGGDVRRTLTTILQQTNGVIRHEQYKEEVGAPRISRSIATFFYPRPDAADWLLTYARAS
jgi:hypothetical protein